MAEIIIVIVLCSFIWGAVVGYGIRGDKDNG